MRANCRVSQVVLMLAAMAPLLADSASEAVDAVSKAFAANPHDQLALQVHVSVCTSLLKAGAHPELAVHSDSAVSERLGNTLQGSAQLQQRDLPAAERSFRKVLATNGDDAQAANFEEHLRDVLIQTAYHPLHSFNARVVSQPNPKELPVAVHDPKSGEADLIVTLQQGQEIAFAGTPKAFTKNPYHLTFAVKRENIIGLSEEFGTPTRNPADRKKTGGKN